jgi:hypothetical protein
MVRKKPDIQKSDMRQTCQTWGRQAWAGGQAGKHAWGRGSGRKASGGGSGRHAWGGGVRQSGMSQGLRQEGSGGQAGRPLGVRLGRAVERPGRRRANRQETSVHAECRAGPGGRQTYGRVSRTGGWIGGLAGIQVLDKFCTKTTLRTNDTGSSFSVLEFYTNSEPKTNIHSMLTRCKLKFFPRWISISVNSLYTLTQSSKILFRVLTQSKVKFLPHWLRHALGSPWGNYQYLQVRKIDQELKSKRIFLFPYSHQNTLYA